MADNNEKEFLSETEFYSPHEFQSDTANYITDSDIDDERYQPYYHRHNNYSFYENKSFNKNLKNINSNEINIIQINKQYENQINFYKNEILKLKENLKAKDITIKEFQDSYPLFNEKFIKLENKNNELKIDNDKLKEKNIIKVIKFLKNILVN